MVTQASEMNATMMPSANEISNKRPADSSGDGEDEQPAPKMLAVGGGGGGDVRLPTADDVETREPEESPELEKACGEECRIHPGAYIAPVFMQTKLASDPNAVLKGVIDKYPVRCNDDPIVPGEVQWIDGTHKALHFRGNPIKRRKIWAQRGPTSKGIRRYGYTGWQWKVLLATVDVAQIHELTAMLEKYDEWCDAMGIPRPDHYIITLYEDGSYSIDWHYDKTPDITPGSIITAEQAEGRLCQAPGRRARDLQRASRPGDGHLHDVPSQRVHATRGTPDRCGADRLDRPPQHLHDHRAGRLAHEEVRSAQGMSPPLGRWSVRSACGLAGTCARAWSVKRSASPAV
jgi:hypothetical protein